MKQQRKGFLAGILTALLIMSLATTAFAAYQKQATLNYNDIKITLDGKALSPKDANGGNVEPFTIDGTTYLPVRAIAEATGLNVAWEQSTQTVKLTTGPAEPSVPSGTHNRANPAPLGVAQTVQVTDYSDSYNVSMLVTNVLRGDAAWKEIKAANMFNKEAPAGKEYVLAKVRASLNSIKSDKALSISDYNLAAFSGTNASYSRAGVVLPSPEFAGSLYAGASIEGYAAFLVDKSDASPKFVYGADYDGSGGIWFSLASGGSSPESGSSNTAKQITLGNGIYSVGKDISAGKYSAVATKSFGLFLVNDVAGKSKVLEILSLTSLPDSIPRYDNLTLVAGDKVEVDGYKEVQILLTPAN